MWKVHRSAALAAASALLLAPTLAGGGAHAAAHHDPTAAGGDRGRPSPDEYTPGGGWATVREGGASDLGPEHFLGADGLIYTRSPSIVDGREGTVYFGEEFDGACAFGDTLPKALKRLAKLARVIEKSGRRVLFTVAPNKSAVNKADLPESRLPHGNCDVAGIEDQDRALDSFDDPNYVPVRKDLADSARAGREVYWHIDTHWTSVGSTQYAKSLAGRLDPRLARRQQFQPTEQTILVDLNFLGILDGVYETGPARISTTKVRVATVPGSSPYDPNELFGTDHEWNTAPAHRTWPGRTLVLGDSFIYRALGGLMPLFRHGRFLWIGDESVPTTIRQIAKSDLVVLEVVQRYLPISLLVKKSFRKHVAKVLAKHHR